VFCRSAALDLAKPSRTPRAAGDPSSGSPHDFPDSPLSVKSLPDVDDELSEASDIAVSVEEEDGCERASDGGCCG